MKVTKTLLSASLCLSAVVATAQYSIPWWKIASGGGTSTGGVYTVSSTIGQHEAGAMSGGQFTLTGGFWAAVAVQTPGAPTMSITPAGQGQATLTWSPDVPGFHLQTTDTMAPPAWTNAPSGATHPITVPLIGAMKFYRLVQP